jgi:hypothetical protein
MESHKRILGILYIVTGIIMLLAMIFVTMLFSMALPWIIDRAQGDEQWVLTWMIPTIQVIAFTLIILVALPSLIGGWGLLNRQSWAMTLVLIVGCLKLFSFPIGTAIGIYTIWVYAEDQRIQKSNA